MFAEIYLFLAIVSAAVWSAVTSTQAITIVESVFVAVVVIVLSLAKIGDEATKREQRKKNESRR